jgi:hypothetical protein
MARALDAGFADIIALARARLTEVRVDEDIEPDRAILAIEGRFAEYRVVVKEVVNQQRRHYAYYVLQEERVILGFDNHADRTALRRKYGENYTAHIFDLVPHRHGPDKTITILTEPWDAVRFLQDLDSLLAPQ